MKGKLFLGIVLLGLLVFIAGACAKEGEDAVDFEDMKWVLETFGEPGNQQAVIEGTRITATFESAEREVNGSAGCNTYFGEYKVSGADLTIMNLASTEMACMEPEGVMDQETQYLTALRTTDGYEIVNGKLRIFSEEYELFFRVE